MNPHAKAPQYDPPEADKSSGPTPDEHPKGTRFNRASGAGWLKMKSFGVVRM